MENDDSVGENRNIDPRLFWSDGASALGIGERNTISNGPDDGTLNKDVTVFWSPMRHGSSTELANNLANPVGAKACNICGHGNVGFFESGAGQQLPYSPGLYVLTWNSDAWGPQFQRLNGLYVQMTIWACETGQGQDGANLLFSLAQHTGCAVRATNGLVWTNGSAIWLESGAVWVTATPSQAPTPVGPPPHLAALEVEGIFSLKTQEGYMNISPGDVSEIRIDRISLLGKQSVNEILTGDTARALAWRLFGSKPFQLPGAPSAMITARATVKFIVPGNEAPEIRTFVIYNDRLVVDVDSGDAYFARPGAAFPL